METFGRFELGARIEGPSPDPAFVAFDPELGRTVAIQLIADRHSSVLDSARRLARVEHPNVVSVFDVGESGGHLYVAMEHVAGVGLDAWLRASARAGWREITRAFVQAGRGLAALLDAGVGRSGFEASDAIVGDDGRVRIRGLVGRAEHGTHGEPSRAFVRALDDALRRRGTEGHRVPRRLRKLLRVGAEREGSFSSWLDDLASLAAEPARDRDRELLLDRLQRSWIDGLLAESPHHPPGLRISLRARPDLATMRIDLPEQPTTGSLAELLDDGVDHILVLGSPGSGKTTALLQLAARLVEDARAEPVEQVPVYLSLASWSPGDGGLDRWIEREVLATYALPRRSVRRWLDRGDLVLLLDGLDEVPARVRGACIEAIDAFVRTAEAAVVVASREDDYVETLARLQLALAVSLQPLDEEEVAAFLRRRGDGLAEIAGRDPALLGHARTPLVLGLLALVGADRHDLRQALYTRYVDDAFARRTEPAPYDRDELLAGLRWLAAAMTRRSASTIRFGRFHPANGWRIGCLHRVALAVFTPLPLRLRRFLDCAVERGLMRRVDRSYTFVHPALSQYLAGVEKSIEPIDGSASPPER